MRFCLSLSLIGLTLAAAFPADNWPEFRGPTGDGISNAKGLPMEWPEQKCNHFRGPGSSPILDKNLLILVFDGFDYQYVAALDKATGQTVWKQDRAIKYSTDNGDYKKAYATGRVIEVNGKPQLVCPS